MRKTDLKRATTGVVVAVVLAVGLLGLLRTRESGMIEASMEAEQGAALFAEKGCSQCHYTDSQHTKGGPGLKGLFDRDRLPVSGRPVSEENVRRQLRDPYRDMPSFADRLTDEERDRLIAYLKEL